MGRQSGLVGSGGKAVTALAGVLVCLAIALSVAASGSASSSGVKLPNPCKLVPLGAVSSIFGQKAKMLGPPPVLESGEVCSILLGPIALQITLFTIPGTVSVAADAGIPHVHEPSLGKLGVLVASPAFTTVRFSRGSYFADIYYPLAAKQQLLEFAHLLSAKL